ncbi:granulocyte-macrophage colony-stimulating factor receptor subunit alpha-like isoform X3 [Loxodonta africana]|uniref:granulocyte-macrophage colony-stimulating factor receptor subunit alpha-like isoform X3 n=1 Tax=Loxodonta africana TaxID=9785 RepID=UPI0030CF2CE1
MVTPLDLVWFWVFLTRACCQPERYQEHLLSAIPVTSPGGPALTQRPFLNISAEKTVSPIINVDLDPRKKMLRWNCRGNVTEERCEIKTPLESFLIPSAQVQEDGTHYCMFPNAVLHQGALLSVAVTSDGDTFQEVLTFNNSGKDGSGAVNFSCVIYNIRFMNCSWAPGPAAPADVQYRLEVWTSLLEDGAECPQYIRDLAGTHVGCHFNILPEPKHPQYIFLLNGTSKETAIPFLDFDPFEAFKMEKYNPPSNITSHYNGSNYIIQWENPQRRFEFASHILDYQLDIQKKIVREGQDRNVYLLPSSEAYGERSLRIRVRHRRSDIWSDWSETLHFSLQKQSCGNVAVILPVVGVAAATLTVLLMVIFRRSSLRQKLFLPIPQVKSFLTPNAEITWEGDHLPPDTEEPEFLIVEEME